MKFGLRAESSNLDSDFLSSLSSFFVEDVAVQKKKISIACPEFGVKL